VAAAHTPKRKQRSVAEVAATVLLVAGTAATGIATLADIGANFLCRDVQD